MKRYPAILSAFYNQPQLVTSAKFLEIDAFLRTRCAGDQVAGDFDGKKHERLTQLLDADGKVVCQLSASQLIAEQLPAGAAQSQQFVAVLPLFGTIFQHGSMEIDYSGGVSTEQWQQQLRKLDANPAIATIIIEAHTPGGQVIGTQETADTLRNIRDAGRTRVVSISNSMMASAGLWIGTAAKEVYVTPGGEIGSLGVVSMHQDISKWEESAGVKTTLVATSQKKIAGNQYEPLSEEARSQLEADNNEVLGRFVKAMAANRNVSTSKAEKDFGGGGMLWAKEAVTAGLADGVITMQDLVTKEVGKLTKTAARKSKRNAIAIAKAQGE